MTNLSELLERVKSAKEGSEALDLAVIQAISPDRVVLRHKNGENLPFTHWRLTTDHGDTTRLIEQMLPGWSWKLGTCSVSDDAWLVPDFNCPVHGERLRKEFGYPEKVPARSIWDEGVDIDRRPSGQPALAMCEAFLSALSALQSQAGK